MLQAEPKAVFRFVLGLVGLQTMQLLLRLALDPLVFHYRSIILQEILLEFLLRLRQT